MVEFKKYFEPNYDAFVVDEAEASDLVYCYPGAIEGGYVDGIGIEFYPNDGSSWFATFAGGDVSPNAVTKALTLPDEKKALIIAKGEAYIVDANDPNSCEHLKLLPVMGCAVSTSERLVLIWDFTSIWGIAAEGIRWKTPSVSWDGISDVRIDGQYAIAQIWDAPSGKNGTVRIDLKDGNFEGGSSPDIIDKSKNA